MSVPRECKRELFSHTSTSLSRRESSLASGLIFSHMIRALALVMELITKALQMTNTVAAQPSAMMNNPFAESQLIYFAKSRL